MSMSWVLGVVSGSWEPVALYLRYVRAMSTLKRGRDSRILFPAVISTEEGSSIVVGHGSFIGAYSEIAVGGNTETGHSTELRVGDNTAIGAFANIRAYANAVYIGNEVLIGQNVSIISSDHARSEVTGRIERYKIDKKVTKPIIICDGAWIGAGSTILPGVYIGRNAIVGAGSVITKNIGENETWVGYSAKRLK